MSDIKEYLNYLAGTERTYKSWCKNTKTAYQWDEEGYAYLEFDNGYFDKTVKFAQECDVNELSALSYEGLTVLHYFIHTNAHEALKILLERGAFVDVRGGAGTRDKYQTSHIGTTPLMFACGHSNLRVIRLLLEYGADQNLTDAVGQNCFHYLAGVEGIKNGTAFSVGWGNDEFYEQKQEIAGLLNCDINKVSDNGYTPLHSLVRDWDTNGSASPYIIDIFLERGADPKIQDSDGNTPLMLAISHNHLGIATALAKYKDTLNMQNNLGETALTLSRIYSNDTDFVMITYLLIDGGADIEIANNEGKTLMSYISQESYDKRSETLAKYVLTKRKNVKNMVEVFDFIRHDGAPYRKESWFTMELARRIVKAIDEDDDHELGYLKMVIDRFERDNPVAVLKMLQERKIDINLQIPINSSEYTSIGSRFMKSISDKPEVLKVMTEMGFDPDKLQGGHTIAYNIVCESIRNTRYFKEEDMAKIYDGVIKALGYVSTESITENGEDGMSAAMYVAEYYDDLRVLKYMIERGIDLSASRKNTTGEKPEDWQNGYTLLHTACSRSNWEMIKLLVDAGADITATNGEGKIPAYFLKKWDSCEELFDFLNKHDDIEAVSDDKGNLLMTAVECDAESDVISYFVKRGADINHRYRYGETMLTYSVLRGEYHRIKRLVENGIDINATNPDGDTALMILIRKKKMKDARYLLKQGADFNITNNDDETALSIAVEKGAKELLKIMIPDEEGN